MASTYFRQLKDESQKFYSGLSRRQRWVLGGVGVIVFVGLLSLTFWLQQPNWGVLYSDLDSKDAGQMVAYLKENDVAYTVETKGVGTTVRVPQDRVHELRLQMAAQDLPLQGGVTGFEIFDQDSNMSMTNRVFDLNYQRALAGELARTIMEIDSVEKARVHLAIPPKQIFVQLQDPATASVTLKMKPMARLSETQVKGISKLVAGSVPGLEQSHVTIADTAGNLLFDADMADDSQNLAQLNRQQLELQRNVEKETRQNVERILSRVVGPGRVSVQVKALLNFDKEESVSKTYQPNDNPAGNNTRALRSEKEVIESGKGTEPVVGGVPGTGSNLPSYREQVTEGEAQYNRSNTTRNFEVPETQTKLTKDPGWVERLTLSVAVDSQSPAIDSPEGLDRNDPLLKSLESLAMTAAGLDVKRGDTIAIYALPFENSVVEAERNAFEQSALREYWQQIALWVILGLLVLAGLITLLIWSSRRRRVQHEARLEEESLLGPIDQYPSLKAAHSPELLEAVARRTQAVKSLTDMAREDPAHVARLLRLWMQESSS